MSVADSSSSFAFSARWSNGFGIAIGLVATAGLLSETDTPAITSALHAAAFVLAAPVALAGTAFFVAIAMLAFATAVFPRWLAVAGGIAALANLGALGGIFTRTGPLNSGNGLVGGIAAPLLAWVLWILLASLWWMRQARPQPAVPFRPPGGEPLEQWFSYAERLTVNNPPRQPGGTNRCSPSQSSPPTGSALPTPGQEETLSMATRTTPNWQALQGGIAGEVVLPDSPSYEELPKPFNARFHDVRPQAIVRCATPQDVAETISFAGRHSLGCATRSGGHCFAGRSLSRGLVIDVTPMGSVAVSGGVATVGAGARLGAVYESLQAYGLAIPAGTCPGVGVAGLTLGGGLGILGRSYGVTSDRLVAAQIVLADGRVLECDENHEEDLFWALRGAGAGNFGVVTSLVFRTVPAPQATNIHLVWPPARAAALIAAWQGWAPVGPDELAASLKVTVAGKVDQPASVDVYGVLLGTESDATALLDELVVRAGSDPIWASAKQMSFSETRRFWAELPVGEDGVGHGLHVPPEQQPYLFVKSEFFKRPLPVEAPAALVENLVQGRAAGESRELDFMPWGGAYNRVPTDATAFVHRDELFQLKHAVVVDPQASTSSKEAAHRWVSRSWASVHPWGSGRVFQNFADPELEGWAGAYYGPNYRRLVGVKARYDPADFFHAQQSLPVR